MIGSLDVGTRKEVVNGLSKWGEGKWTLASLFSSSLSNRTSLYLLYGASIS